MTTMGRGGTSSRKVERDAMKMGPGLATRSMVSAKYDASMVVNAG